jgi:hypothetical protein
MVMIVLVGGRPCWICDQCYGPVRQGIVLSTPASRSGHFPAVTVCCSEACAQVAAHKLTVDEVRRMPWAAFVTALTER